eukprot:6557736-Pyramimonas_sp.AAC.1
MRAAAVTSRLLYQMRLKKHFLDKLEGALFQDSGGHPRLRGLSKERRRVVLGVARFCGREASKGSQGMGRREFNE